MRLGLNGANSARTVMDDEYSLLGRLPQFEKPMSYHDFMVKYG
jgi:hypothetical protein